MAEAPAAADALLNQDEGDEEATLIVSPSSSTKQINGTDLSTLPLLRTTPRTLLGGWLEQMPLLN